LYPKFVVGVDMISDILRNRTI